MYKNSINWCEKMIHEMKYESLKNKTLIYIYIYRHMCTCVCVCLCVFSLSSHITLISTPPLPKSRSRLWSVPKHLPPAWLMSPSSCHHPLSEVTVYFILFVLKVLLTFIPLGGDVCVLMQWHKRGSLSSAHESHIFPFTMYIPATGLTSGGLAAGAFTSCHLTCCSSTCSFHHTACILGFFFYWYYHGKVDTQT